MVRLEKRFGARKFIAYFQSFTNTYASCTRLAEIYEEALAHPGIVGLAVGTRPDCVSPEILGLLASFRERALVWIEYGLQSANDSTLMRINRGHDVACFGRAVRMAREVGLNVCAHVILGLPGEDREDMLATADYLASQPIQGVKIHALYAVKSTELGGLLERGEVVLLDRETYVDRVVDFVERLPPDVVIHRLTGDPPAGCELLGPLWAREKSRNLGLIRERLEQRNTWQGRLVGQKRGREGPPV
jgi:radical SAM protein (TIGR01212 family)